VSDVQRTLRISKEETSRGAEKDNGVGEGKSQEKGEGEKVIPGRRKAAKNPRVRRQNYDSVPPSELPMEGGPSPEGPTFNSREGWKINRKRKR